MIKNRKRGQNEGSIREKFRRDPKTGAMISIGWEARYSIPGQKQKSLFAKTRTEASKKLTKALADINDGTFVERSKVTIREWMNTWLWEYKKPSVKIISFTRSESLSRVHIVPAIGGLYLKDLRPDHLQKLINDKIKDDKSPRTIKYIHVTIQDALDQAVKNGLVIRNVAKSVSLPLQEKKKIRVFTQSEQKIFLDIIKGDRLEAAYILALSTGVRLGELLALEWSDIDLEEGSIRISKNIQRIKNFDASIGERKTKLVISNSPKTKAGNRNIPILDEVVAVLKKHKIKQLEERLKAGEVYCDNNIVFCNEIGNYIEPRRLIGLFTHLIEDAGIDKLNFHALRHTFATRALEKGMQPKVVQEILGHSSITMTLDLYSHVLPETKKEQMQRLSGLFSS